MNMILPARFEIAWKPWLRWTAGFAGFPLAGVAARAVAGNIDGAAAAVAGGLAAGAVLGVAQSLALPSGSSNRGAWVAATAAGMAAGLPLAAGAIGYQTDTQSLVVMGAINGAVVGLAQAAVADLSMVRRVAWAIVTPALWAAGWLITANVIVDADRQHAMFGSSGAIVVAAASGLLFALRSATTSHDSPRAHSTNGKVVVS